jgi:ATP-dependent Lon protease
MNRPDSPDEAIKIPDVLPVLPLKDAVVFPYIILPLSVGRDKSVLAVDRALAESRVIMLAAQRDGALDNPGEGDLHEVGTAAVIMRMLKLPDGRIRILVQGLARARVKHISQLEPYLQAKIERIEDAPAAAGTMEIEALVRSVKDSLDRAVTLGKGISPEVMVIAANLQEPGRLADLAASNLDLKLAEAQDILETTDVVARLRKVSDLLAHEIQVLTMQQEISSQARGEIDRSQREYFLRQQLKAIQQELGEGEELGEEIALYRQLGDEKKLSKDGREELERQIRRLERSHPESAETQIIRTYLDWLTALPWETLSEDDLDLAHAQQVLDDDHYDLEKIKERILEYLAVRKLKPDTRGPILCFVGPPGVGKTSLGRSIARSLGRRFVRLSLGGVRDEAEIRGHRRTYVGALPGRILQGIRQAGTSNPVFVLDEIDKIGADFRGDPSSALLEVLDPEQNWSFVDHYLGLAYDLSRVLFIATANMLEPIQPAFLDRMEVLRLTGYTEEEKLQIAERHLVPKQMRENGVTAEHIAFAPDGIRQVISGYTKEAGLRNLERELAAICRKVAVRVARGETTLVTVGPAQVEEFLGARKHFAEELLERDRVGVATGLAWTAAGGDLLFIEVVAVPGKGQLLLTGQLGDVMKESAQAALSFARAWAGAHEMSPDYFAKHDIHIHVPAGSIPKDGPSAGITIGTAILSVLTGRPVNRRVAMTGEITLRGDVLPIGGLKEKVLAAKLAGVHTVIVPKLNHRDLTEVPETIKKGLTFHFVEHMDEVLELALLAPVVPVAPAARAPDAATPQLPAASPAATRPERAPATPPAAARQIKPPASGRRSIKPPVSKPPAAVR